MAAMPMLAGVGLLMVCCSSSSAMTMMGGGDGDDSSGGGWRHPLPLKPQPAFHASEIPDAMVIDVGEIPMAYMEGDAVVGTSHGADLTQGFS